MVNVSNAIIDMLSLTYSCNASTQDGIEGLIGAHKETVNVNEDLYQIRYLHSNYQGQKYRKNWHLIIESQNTSPVLLQVAPFNIGAAGFRIQWNPNKLGVHRHVQLWEILEQILVNEYECFLEEAIVTRIDVAVDVEEITPDSIWVEARNLHHGDIKTGDLGEIQTMMLGARGSNTHFCIYSRNAENQQQSTSTNITRIEVRLRPRCSLIELQSITNNPFLRLTVVNAIDPVILDIIPDRYKLFLDSARLRGLQGALRILSRSETRNAYRDWITENLCTDWFYPDEIWNGYSRALRILELPEQVRINKRVYNGQMIRTRQLTA